MSLFSAHERVSLISESESPWSRDMENIENYINEAGKGEFGDGSGSSMRSKSVLVMLSILLVPVSGCIESGDGPQVEVTSEDLQYLFEENFDDFVNNTTITVNQDVNYYNNTSIQQPSTLKSSSGTMTGIETVDMYPVGLALLVRDDRFSEDSHGGSADDLGGANICLGIGTVMEGELQDWFSSMEISFTSVPVADAAEATAKFIDGSCDAMAIASDQLAEEKKAQLDEDGSMSGVDIWVVTLYDGSPDSPGMVGNSFSITISQSSDEMISGFVYILAQVDLMGTCHENSSNCSDFSATMELSGYEMVTTCSHGFTNSYLMEFQGDSDYIEYIEAVLSEQLTGYGLDCIHSLNFNVSQMTGNIAGYDYAVHELSWGDWVYSVVWESIPIEQTS